MILRHVLCWKRSRSTSLLLGHLYKKPPKELVSVLFSPEYLSYLIPTVNLHIERMNTGRYFSKNCVLLAIRPVKIADKNVSEHFCKYEPAKEYVYIHYHCVLCDLVYSLYV